MAKITWNPKKLEALRRRLESFQGINAEIHRDREDLNQQLGALRISREDTIRQGNYRRADIERIDAEIARIEKARAAVQERYSESSECHKNVITLFAACKTFLQSQKLDPDRQGEFRGYTGYTMKTKGGQGS